MNRFYVTNTDHGYILMDAAKGREVDTEGRDVFGEAERLNEAMARRDAMSDAQRAQQLSELGRRDYAIYREWCARV